MPVGHDDHGTDDGRLGGVCDPVSTPRSLLFVLIALEEVLRGFVASRCKESE